ncbi:MAG TPA: ATP-binding protein, partial [Terriglobales bacterium]|nr:ATP-binding protein [Terriglobales bacterium]
MSEHRIEVANCKRHGDFEQKVWIMCPGPDAFEMRAPHSCPKCVDEREAERRTRQRLERIAYNRQRANIPRRFADCSIDNYEAITTAQRTALNTAKAFAENFAAVVAAGSSLTFCGPSGTGKTHLACAIANHVLDAGGTVIYEQAIELIRKIRETWRRDSHETEVEVIGRYRAVDLLILDEI